MCLSDFVCSFVCICNYSKNNEHIIVIIFIWIVPDKGRSGKILKNIWIIFLIQIFSSTNCLSDFL